MTDKSLILINAVGMTRRLLDYAPRMKSLAESGWARSLLEVLPAVTSTAQATILTGKNPAEHGIVANGWLFRDTMEIRFWQQSNRLLQAEPIYTTLRRGRALQGKPFKCAKLFWWYNQGADVNVSVTPKPHYGADGNKAFGIAGSPAGFAETLETKIGAFPFPAFWGPMAGLPSSVWIAKATQSALESFKPDLTLAYLPHLDYDPQRFGPSGCDMKKLVGELDDSLQPILDVAKKIDARVWIVSEYGHCDVRRPIFPNHILREVGLLTVRDGPFGETIDTFASRAVAVCDHQICHIYLGQAGSVSHQELANIFSRIDGVAAVYAGSRRSEIGLDHSRAGDLILLAKRDSWFAYPYWLDDARAPDFARTVDIHRKPGVDPCEMFFDPNLRFPKLRVARRLLQKKLGFRSLFDVTPLDAGIVRGSHGLRAADPLDRPILIGDGPEPTADLAMTDVHRLLLAAFGFANTGSEVGG